MEPQFYGYPSVSQDICYAFKFAADPRTKDELSKVQACFTEGGAK